jgi:NAD-dependent deacetylase
MKIQKVADLIKNSNYTVILSGAGISTPSGIPDFRSSNSSIWQKHDPMEVASLTAFRYNPLKLFEWFRPLLNLIFSAEPNPAHTAIAEMENAGLVKEIITQNIDGLHQRAGSKTVHEIHGTITTLTCTSCYLQFKASQFLQSFLNHNKIPYCKQCGHLLKPDVILYEEQLPYNTWMLAEKAVNNADLLIVVGSSLVVTPVATLPIIALNNGAKLVVLNNTPTYVDVRAEIVIQDDVAITLPLIQKEVLSER